MASYLEQLLEVFDDIPQRVTQEIHKLREIDEENAKIGQELDQEEKELVAKLREAETDDNFLAKIEELQARRAALDAAMQTQIKKSQDIYDLIDQPINTLDGYIKDLSEIATRPKNDSRKKRKGNTSEQNIVLAPSPGSEYVDPNEPIYCFCRRVSYGRMVGCDNEECPIEWFHFDCVGVTEEPTDSWYCSECRPKFVKTEEQS